MGKNGSVIVLLFLFMILFGQSNAFNSRKLVDPNGISNVNQDSPSSSPPPDDKKPNLSAEAPKSKDSPNTTPSNVKSKGLNNANNKTTSENSSDKILENGKDKIENEKRLKTFDSKSCKGNLSCSDQEKTMIACIQDFESGSNKLTLLVQNEQDTNLKVNITFGTSMNNNLPAFEIPGHGTEKINITFSGDGKVNLNAGNGDCELQIGQPKTTPVDNPSKSKKPENTLNPKNVNDPVDSPAKPKDGTPVDSPAKVKDVDDPSKAEKSDSPAKPKDVNAKNPNNVDAPAKLPKEVDDPSKSKEVNDPSKSKDVNDPSKSKEVNDPLKSKDVNNPSKSKDVSDPAKSKDVADPSKSKDINNPSKSKDINDPTKSKDVDDPSKSKDVDDPSKSKDVDDPTKSEVKSVDTPISQNNILDQLTFYSKQVTPIYGAYFAFLVALVIGGSWALCSFRKRRTDGGVPYQELEMGIPESSNAIDVEPTEGWDQDWDDDDWDEDKAIRSPGGGIQARSISSNGLTSRATKKDGWDADWDD